MSNHRRPDSLAHDETETRPVDTTHHRIRAIPHIGVYDQIPAPLPATATHRFGEVRVAPQSIRLR